MAAGRGSVVTYMMKLSLPAACIRAALLLPVIACPSGVAVAGDIASGTDFADNVQFDPTFISSSFSRGADLSQFSRPDALPEGEYQAAVYLNGTQLFTAPLSLRRQPGGEITPCLSSDLLSRLGLDTVALSGLAGHADCPDLAAVIPAAGARFDTENQRLDISIPQKYLTHAARGEVAASEWDEGVPAAFAAYSASSYRSAVSGRHYDSQYVGVNSGLNLGGWYFRHNGAWSAQTGSAGKYRPTNTYVQHDVTPVSGRLLAGQANTTGRLFDTLPFTGASLFSDDQMLPQSRRGYAPEIRGVASSHARVTVRQGDAVIYETTVSPGEFVINDLYPSGYGGDLLVTVREADGTEKSFRVAYSSLADLLRPGVHRYEVVAGQYRTEYDGTNGKPLGQAIWQQGVTNFLTLYGGAQVGEDYHALQGGAAFDTPVGAVSVDMTHADTRAGQDTQRGESYRISYNKMIQQTGSNLALAAYRFSTAGYLDFASAMQYLDLHHHSIWLGDFWREKERFVVSLQQSLGEQGGSLYLSSLWQDAWQDAGWRQQYTVGYNNSWGRVNYSLSLNRSRRMDSGRFENTGMLSMNVPLGSASAVMLNTGLARDSEGGWSEQAGLSGSAGEESRLNWSLGGSHDDYGNSSGNAQAGYRSSLATLGAGVSTSRNSRTLSGNLSGAIVAHPKGVTLTPYTADSYVVVSAPGAAGAHLPQYPEVTLDHWGNAVVPVWTPYSRNEVSLDPKGIPSNVELDETSRYTVPRAGAVTLAGFKTHHGYPLLLSPEDGVALPFGSNVSAGGGAFVGLVSQGGAVYVRVPDEDGELQVAWRDGGQQKNCVVPYHLSRHEQSLALIKKTYTCR